MDPTVIISTAIWGLVIGCIYILLATGLNVIFGVMKLVNFAHGQLLMIGAFVAWTFVFATGLNAYIGLLVSMVVVAALGVIIERFTFRKVLGTDKLNEIFVSLGLIIILENAAALTWGYQPYTQLKNYSPFYGANLFLGNITIPLDRIAVMFMVFGILVSLAFLLKKTKIGLAMRATSQRSGTASLMGININRVYMFTFALGAALAAAAGTIYGIISSFDYQVGALPTIIAFAIIILGGLGSIKGAIIGGLLFGLTQQMATLFFGGTWGDAAAFALLIVVLIIRPTGIFGDKDE